jgi:hypothetical protein
VRAALAAVGGGGDQPDGRRVGRLDDDARWKSLGLVDAPSLERPHRSSMLMLS